MTELPAAARCANCQRLYPEASLVPVARYGNTTLDMCPSCRQVFTSQVETKVVGLDKNPPPATVKRRYVRRK